MRKRAYPIALIGVAAAVYVFSSCSVTSTVDPTTTTGALSSYADSLAEDMLLASPTATRSVSGFSVSEVSPFADTASPGDGLKKKKEAVEALLASAAPATCAISLTIQNSTNANCYGPNVNYTNHPDATGTPGSYPGGDLGLWEANATSGEACSSDQLNSRLKGVASYADLAVFMMSGMACLANKNGTPLPAASGNVDLTALMTGNLNINGRPCNSYVGSSLS